MALWYGKKAYALLKKCSDAKDLTEWNAYRKKTNHASINLRFSNLKDFYLVDADLRDVDLRGTILVRTKCYFSDVAHTNISTKIFWKVFFGLIMVYSLFIFAKYILGNGITAVQTHLVALLSFSAFIGLPLRDLLFELESSAQKSIAYAKNPEEAIGFNLVGNNSPTLGSIQNRP